MPMTRMRSAAGVCVLSATLFLGSAAVAVADTGSEGGGSSSQTSTGGTESSSPTSSGSATSITKNVRPGAVLAGAIQDRVRTTVRDFTGALNGLGQHQVPKVTIFPKPRTQQTATDSSTVSATAPTGSTEPSAPVDDPTTPLTDPATPLATTLDAPASTSPAATFPTLRVTPPPVSKLAASLTGSMNSAANSAKDAIDALPALLASLPTSTNPVGDVLATVQSVLTSVGESVTTISEIPGDLSTLLGFPPSTAPTATIGGTAGALRTAPAPATASPIDLLPAMLAQAPAVTSGGSAAGGVTAPPAFAGTVAAGLSQELANTAPLSLHGVSSAGSTASVLERAVSKMLVPVSIAALAALALPGVGGLLVVSALGVRIGYRQAKANFVLQASGISRFAGPGPLGVVRSGSFISLHERTGRTRVARTGRPATAQLRAVRSVLDRAA